MVNSLLDCIFRNCLDPTNRRRRGGSASSTAARIRPGGFFGVFFRDPDGESDSTDDQSPRQISMSDQIGVSSVPSPSPPHVPDRDFNEQEEYMSMYCPKTRAVSDASAYERLAAASDASGCSADGEMEGHQNSFLLPHLAYDEVVLPGSKLQAAMAKRYSAAVGVAAGEGAGDGTDGEECVICLEGFDQDNPRMPTTCGCGRNATFFHLPCLYQWVDRNEDCPSCRQKLFWDEL